MTKKAALYRVGQVLNEYLNRADIKTKILEQRVLTAWEQVVGKGIADVTQFVTLVERAIRVVHGMTQLSERRAMGVERRLGAAPPAPAAPSSTTHSAMQSEKPATHAAAWAS